MSKEITSGSVSRRSFLLKSTMGAAALTSGFISPLFIKASTVKSSVSRLLPGAGDNDTIHTAKRNIPKIRMREAEISLLDRNGQPLINREVKIEQLKHQFLFGDDNWSIARMFRNGQINHDKAKYWRKRFSDLFNAQLTTVYWTERPGNDATKTEDFQGDLQMDDFNDSVDWANANGLTAKGHPICWTVPKAIPEWIKQYPMETFMKFLEVRVRDLCARYKGKVQLWDAVNEMLWETAPRNLTIRKWPYTETMENMVEYISLVLKWAREEDPDAMYCINDYGLGRSDKEKLIDQNGDVVTAARQRKRFIELAKRLGDAGYPPSLLGDQTRPAWLFPSDQVAIYDELSEAGIPLSVTEFWADNNELRAIPGEKFMEYEEWSKMKGKSAGKEFSEDEFEQIRDEFIVNFLTCAFGHPSIHSFFFGGFFDNAKIFTRENSSHTLKPIYNKLHDLTHKEWNTSLTLKTDSNGMVSFRGYCGDYSIRIKNDMENAPGLGIKFRIDKDYDPNKRVFKTIL